uniref:Cyclomaltodextrin glucanotransferase n=2 Tax=Geobacillus stearothermophilus TaxID=1422 RepID=CDGT_GEOSE|nr:RecName: Full=Cyclomaltodextrin glucanotransferase; AltName: Full=Cyclodextrin-glycosyltransferase; Short=CGTase; Flags: Precursor [Geobacillus stearothermophilus]CAA41770.1 cyclomaltodextrin glucanotransferase [Geobacillus stearothermophilus]CAA41771.1 cyclomaltodextrin glucanotransferase [Geobacillus stearothermophilus]CAA41772.1 cyclomaltodextrin glucanotransferase [Geobacillus stearothermophilus]
MRRWLSLVLSMSFVFSAIFIVSDTQKVTVEAAGNLNKVNFTSDVVYQIVVDRFVDGNTSNNPSGALFSSGCTNLRKYCGGDWQGIINKINDGYLTDMGVTAIWISQPVENVFSVMNDASGSASYHGYWARDFKKPNPFFGTLSDFQRLVDAAHAKGIKVIIDFAPNHTSPASETNPSYMENGRLYDNGTLLGGYTNDANMYFHHNGGTTFSSLEDGIYRNLFDLADLNHQNPVIDRYLKDAVKMWIDMGIDGIRMDAVKHMPFGWQKSLMDEIDNYRPVFTFGEWFLSENEVDANNHYFANESGMSLLDFRFGQKLRQVLRNNSDNWYGFNQMIQDTASAYDEVLDQVTFIDNHDMDRFMIDGGDPRKVDMALAVLLTSRGVPNIYYGTEQYMTGNGDPNNRKMMSSFNKNTRAYQVIQKLSSLRRNNPALAYGDTEQRWINGDVYVYERQFGKDVVLVAVNRSSSSNYSITGLFTALPAGTYTDQLGGLLDGNTIQVGSNGSVNAFDLGPGEVGVWAYSATESTPIIGHVGPMMGQVGHQVTIDGEGFGTNTGTVKFGTTAANVVSWSNNQIVVAVPNVSPGKYNITVQSSSGQTSAAYDNFEVLTNDQVSVRFVVNNATTNLGQNIYIVGNVYELGNWDTSKAIGPMFNQVVYSYPTWYIDVSVPEGKTIEFKFIKKDSQGNVTWESGSNHVYTTPTNTTGKIIVDWQN